MCSNEGDMPAPNAFANRRYRYEARAQIHRRRIFDTLRINLCVVTKEICRLFVKDQLPVHLYPYRIMIGKPFFLRQFGIDMQYFRHINVYAIAN